MARTPEQRGPFGRWLVSERKARGWTADDFRARLQEARGFAMAHSTFALLESGQRQPTDEQRRHLTAFLGSEPALEVTDSGAGQSADIAALTAIVTQLVTQLQEERREWREEREEWKRLVDRLLPGGLGATPLEDADDDEDEDPMTRAARGADTRARRDSGPVAEAIQRASLRPPSARRTPAGRTTP